MATTSLPAPADRLGRCLAARWSHNWFLGAAHLAVLAATPSSHQPPHSPLQLICLYSGEAPPPRQIWPLQHWAEAHSQAIMEVCRHLCLYSTLLYIRRD